jgi:glucose/arabinose dehydrogenase
MTMYLRLTTLYVASLFLVLGASAQPLVSDSEVPEQGDVALTTVVDGLERPWGVAWLPSGDALITERPGRLRIVRDGQLDPKPITGLPEIMAQRQGGLMDVAVHPQFEQNQLVYLTYSHGDRGANQTRVARARFDGETLSDLEVILQADPMKRGGQHFGSRLLWMPDGTLLVSIGDGGNPPIRILGDFIRNQAQNPATPFGKTLRINDDGTIPSDNPRVAEGAHPALFTYGHRNIQGIAIDPATGAVWASEHGALGGDELNLIAPGSNYGWPEVTYSREYSGDTITDVRSRDGVTDPVAVWQNTIAPSGLVVYSGTAFPEWSGDVLTGGLVSQDVRRIDLDESGRAVSEHSIRIGQRVRDVRVGPDGHLYVLTDTDDGRLIRVSPSAP